MTRVLRRRPAPAMVVALIALFLALGGVSYGFATGSIDSREIKDNTVRSKDLRNNNIRTRDIRNNEVRGRDIRNSTVRTEDIAFNTIPGNDVNESTLGKVPSAAQADAATSATSAASVGGVSAKEIGFSAPAGTGFTTILDFGGLVLEAECQAADVLVRANPAAGLAGSAIFDQIGLAKGNGDFDPGDNQPVVESGEAISDGISGDLVFRGTGGSTVTVELYALASSDSIPGSASNDCGVFGVAFAG